MRRQTEWWRFLRKGQKGGQKHPSLPAPQIADVRFDENLGYGVGSVNISDGDALLSRSAGNPCGEGIPRPLKQGSRKTSCPSWVRLGQL